MSQANQEHFVRIHINDYQDSMLLLASYYGEKVYLVDSAFKTQNDDFIFKGNEALPPGMYVAINSKKEKLFEFIINKNQNFSLSTRGDNYVLGMIVNNSPENEVFFNYVRRSSDFRKQEYKLTEQQKLFPDTTENFKALQSEIDSTRKNAINFNNKIIDSIPELFISVVLKAMKEVIIPDSLTESGDKEIIFRYFKEHYWDNFNLSDERLLRTPLMAKRVDQYFSNAIKFHPDSVITAIDYVISKAGPSDEVVSWLVWQFISKYQNPEYMGFDKVFVHMVDAYISKEEISNTTPSIVESLQERANQIRPLLLGKPAPNLILLDTTGAYFSFQSMLNEVII